MNKTIAAPPEPKNKLTLDMSFGPMDAIAAGDTSRLMLIQGRISDALLRWLEGDRRRPIDANRANLLFQSFFLAAQRTGWDPARVSPETRLLRFGVTDQGTILELWAWIQPFETNRVFLETARRAGSVQGLTLAAN